MIVAGTAISVPSSITQPSVAHAPIIRDERAGAIDEVAQQTAAPRPPRIASTVAKSDRRDVRASARRGSVVEAREFRPCDHPTMLESPGVQLLVLAGVAPTVAAISAILYATSPRRQRDGMVRGALILSVSLTAVEGLVGALIVGFLVLLQVTGGVRDF